MSKVAIVGEFARFLATRKRYWLLPMALTLLLLGLLEGGVRWEWDSLTSILLFAVAAVLLAGFVLVERRAVEPVLPLWLFRHRVVVAAMTTSLVVGVLMTGAGCVRGFRCGVAATLDEQARDSRRLADEVLCRRRLVIDVAGIDLGATVE